MAQKINPLIFRQFLSNSQHITWFSKTKLYPQFLSQELELRNFLTYLLKSRGIVLRSCKISRVNQTLTLELDLYFSFLLGKYSKSVWARNFFRSVKKKYLHLNRIKELKVFLKNLNNPLSMDLVEAKDLPDKVANKTTGSLELSYNRRFFFFFKEKRKKKKREKDYLSFVGIKKRSNFPKFFRLKFLKLKKLFKIRKLKYDFQKFSCNNFLKSFRKSKSLNLLAVNKMLCKSLQQYTGMEKIKLKVSSTQLHFLPSLKLYSKRIRKKLSFYGRNQNIKKIFSESIEILYFVLSTFSFGNASLLTKYIIYLLESNRKQIFIVRFLKKILNVLFTKLPNNFLSISGIKILLKGRFNKRRRTKTIILQEGQNSLQTLDCIIDYYQTHAVTLYGTFGLKVWISKKNKE